MRNKLIIFSVVVISTLTGCKDVLERYPLDSPSAETFYNNALEIERGVNTCYEVIRELEDNQYVMPITFDLFTDIGFARQGADNQAVAKGEHSSRTNMFYGYWRRAYRGISRCNTMLKVIEEKPELLTAEQIKQFRGEALFLRAFYYSRLVNHFGDVPLLLEPEYIVSEARNVSRTPKEQVIAQIVTDFTEAADLLPEEYTKDTDKGRATKGAANTFMARLALYQGMYDLAAASAGKVIDSKVYSLYPKYGDLFVTKGLRDNNNKELIFVEDYSTEIKKFTQLVLLSSTRNTGGWATIVPSQNLIDSYHCLDDMNIDESPMFDKSKPFENRDPRLKLSFVVPGERFGDFRLESHVDSLTCYRYSTGTMVTNNDCYTVNQFTSYTGYYVRKYNDVDYISKNTLGDYPIIQSRYAEVLLTYAEAKIELNEIDQSVVDALNAIRQDRDDVKMPTFTLASLGGQEQARRIVRHERKVELAFEGFRYMDLRRWGWADTYLNRPLVGRPFKGSFTEWPAVTFDTNGEPVYDVDDYEPHPSTDYRVVEPRSFIKGQHELWPIPQTERDMNSNLSQNPNY